MSGNIYLFKLILNPIKIVGLITNRSQDVVNIDIYKKNFLNTFGMFGYHFYFFSKRNKEILPPTQTT